MLIFRFEGSRGPCGRVGESRGSRGRIQSSKVHRVRGDVGVGTPKVKLETNLRLVLPLNNEK